jgi:hypothetical protein
MKKEKLMRIILSVILMCALSASTLMFAGCPGPDKDEFIFTLIAGHGGMISYRQLGRDITPGNPYVGKFADSTGIGPALTLVAGGTDGYEFRAWYLIDGNTRINLTEFDFSGTGINIFSWGLIDVQSSELLDAVIEAYKDMKSLTLMAEFAPMPINLFVHSIFSYMGDVFANGIQIGIDDFVETAWDQTVSLSAVAKEGYEFVGWFDGRGEGSNLLSDNPEFDYIAGTNVTSVDENNVRIEHIYALFQPIV